MANSTSKSIIDQQAHERPEVKYLIKYVTKEVAVYHESDKWWSLGVELLGEDGISGLNVIKANGHNNVQKYCLEMLMLWRDKHPGASWSQLIEALRQVELNSLAKDIEKRLKPLAEQEDNIISTMQCLTMYSTLDQVKQNDAQRESTKECSTPSIPNPSAMSIAHQDAVKNNEILSTVDSATVPSPIATIDTAVSHDVVLQEQIIQQQSVKLQWISDELATAKMLLEQARAEGERNTMQVKKTLLQELDLVKNQLKELQKELQEEKTASTKLKMKISNLESKMCEDKRAPSEKTIEAIQQQNKLLSDELHKKMTSTFDKMKMRLHRTELERDQLQQTIQLRQQWHSEEIQLIKKFYSTCITTIEEAHQQREQSWKEEQKREAAGYAKQVQQLKQEILYSAIAQKKNLEALEISNNNEIKKLQALHRSNAHELKLQHLKILHEQEMAALKAGFSHTRALTDLTCQLETSSHEINRLQQKIDKAELKQRGETLRISRTTEGD